MMILMIVVVAKLNYILSSLGRGQSNPCQLCIESRALQDPQIQEYFGISPTAGGGGLGRLRSSPPSPSPSPQVQRGEAELDLGTWTWTRGT